MSGHARQSKPGLDLISDSCPLMRHSLSRSLHPYFSLVLSIHLSLFAYIYNRTAIAPGLVASPSTKQITKYLRTTRPVVPLTMFPSFKDVNSHLVFLPVRAMASFPHTHSCYSSSYSGSCCTKDNVWNCMQEEIPWNGEELQGFTVLKGDMILTFSTKEKKKIFLEFPLSRITTANKVLIWFL